MSTPTSSTINRVRSLRTAHSDLIDRFRVEVATRSRWNVWGKAKKIFVKAGKTRRELKRRAVEKLENHQVSLLSLSLSLSLSLLATKRSSVRSFSRTQRSMKVSI